MINFWWDGCNKWLYFGNKECQANQFILMFGDWMYWFSCKMPMTRTWNLFQISWDNGAWWGIDLDKEDKISVPKMSEEDPTKMETEDWITKSGMSQRYIQIILLGIGLRYHYEEFMGMVYKLPRI